MSYQFQLISSEKVSRSDGGSSWKFMNFIKEANGSESQLVPKFGARGCKHFSATRLMCKCIVIGVIGWRLNKGLRFQH